MKWKVASGTWRQGVFADARCEYEVAVSHVKAERKEWI